MGATNCPETPRQKMITMMYLVYTAMLALNVSAEVVEGFRSVGTAMTASNINLQTKLDDTYANFDLAFKNSPDKVRSQYDKAQQVKALSSRLEEFIDSLECEFIGKFAEEAEIVMDIHNPKDKRVIKLKNEDGTVNHDSVRYALKVGGFAWMEKGLDDTHEAPKFFLEGTTTASGIGEAITLKKKVIAYRAAVKEILGEDSTKVNFPFDVDKTFLNKDKQEVDWEHKNFDEVVAGAGLVTLTRMKAEAMNAEFDAVNMLYKQVNKGDKNFSNIQMLSMPKSAYVMRGGVYETNIRVGAYDPDQRFRVVVNGQSSTSDESGTALYKMVCNNVGPQTIRGKAVLTTQDGEEEYEFTDEFYVAEPSANIMLDNMNVLYAGIENPITASAPGMASRDIKVSIDPAAGKLSPSQGDGKYNITPNPTAKKVEVSVYGMVDGQQKLLNTIPFRVKAIPDPVLQVGTYKNGEKKASRKDFTESTTVLATRADGFDFKIPKGSIRIKTMNITVGTKTCAPIENSGKLNAEVISAIKKASRGDNLVISATVQMPDGRPREVDCVIKLAK